MIDTCVEVNTASVALTVHLVLIQIAFTGSTVDPKVVSSSCQWKSSCAASWMLLAGGRRNSLVLPANRSGLEPGTIELMCVSFSCPILPSSESFVPALS